MMNFNELNLVELKKIAKENGISNISKLKKEELIDVLSSNLGNKQKKIK